MEKKSNGKRKKIFLTLFFGLISTALYITLFSNQEWVTENYTKGSWYAAFPIGTAFIFSFIHGAFASNFLSLIGLEAKKK